MADPFRVEPKGKSWADIVEEDEQSDLLDSQHEERPLASKEEPNEESDAALVDAHAVSTTPSSDQQADSNKDSIAPQEPPTVEDKPILTGSRASKWASAPSEPRAQSKWQSSSSSASKGGTMASKWASAPDSRSRSRYDNNRNTRYDSYNRFGGNGLPRNDRWREERPSGGRLNRSAFEDEDVRNGGFNNKANFSREKRYQEYQELTSKEAAKDEALEHKNAIESWNAYKPPAEENEETAKQLVEAANEIEQTSTEQTTNKEQQDASIAQKEDSKEFEVSPTKTVEPVKPTVASSPSLKPVSSFSWADDIPDDNSDDDSDYPIPADWITPKVVAHVSTAEVQEAYTTPQSTGNDIKESTTDDLSVEPDLETAANARLSSPEEVNPELSQSTRDTDPVDTRTIPLEAAVATPPREAPKEERHVYTWGALNDYKEPKTTIPKADNVAKMNKGQEEAAVAAWNSLKLPEETEEEVVASTTKEKSLSTVQGTEKESSWNQSAEPSWDQANKEQSNGAVETHQQQLQEPIPEPKPTYTWGALDDYKDPEISAPKSDDTVKIDKEQEEAAVAAWNSAKLPEEQEEKVVATTIEDDKPLWSQTTEEQPSWNQANEEKLSWNEPTETSWDQPDREQPIAQQQEIASESKPVYTWGALNDYKEPELIAKPKTDIVCISKEDEEAAISAWNSVRLPEEPEATEEKSQEPASDTPSWNSAAQNSAPVQPPPSWSATAQEPEPAKAESSWSAMLVESSWNSTDAHATSWSAVEQPSWPEHSATADANTLQDWTTNSFQEGSSVTSKSSFKDTWRNKLPTTVDDNAGGWKSFVETVAVPPEPAAKQSVKESVATVPQESTFKRTEKGSAASRWSHDRYNDAELSHPRPSQRKPHNLSFKLNDFKEAKDNEVHVSWKDIQAQENPKISIKDDTSDRQATVSLTELSQANPQQDIVLRLNDLTSGRPWDSAHQQQQHQGPLEVTLSFSELNKGRSGADSTPTSSNPVPAGSAGNYSSSGPKEIVCKLSDFGKKEKADGPLDVSLKLF